MFVMKLSHKIIKQMSDQKKEVNRHCFFPRDISNRMVSEVSETILDLHLLDEKSDGAIYGGLWGSRLLGLIFKSAMRSTVEKYWNWE